MSAGRPGRLETIGFAVAFALAGVLLSVYVVSGEGIYARLADPAGAVIRVEGKPKAVDRGTLVELHRDTLHYLLGAGDRLPDAPGTRAPLFDLSERGHMADVRTVFGGMRLLLAAALIGLVWRVASAARRGTLHLARLARRGATIAAALVAVVAIAAAVAFEPLFLAFHLVFFPQGNFLFDPATSNLLALYPLPYWYGVTLLLGALFVASAGLVALVGTVVAHRSSIHSKT